MSIPRRSKEWSTIGGVAFKKFLKDIGPNLKVKDKELNLSSVWPQVNELLRSLNKSNIKKGRQPSKKCIDRHIYCNKNSVEGGRLQSCYMHRDFLSHTARSAKNESEDSYRLWDDP